MPEAPRSPATGSSGSVSGGRVRAITVAELPVQTNALALLLSTDGEIDVVSSETYVDRARAAILRHRPDVVVISSSDHRLGAYRRLLDLQHVMPDIGFVVVPANRAGAPRGADVDRAVTVLPADFTLDGLRAAVTTAGRRTAADHDREYISAPVSTSAG